MVSILFLSIIPFSIFIVAIFFYRLGLKHNKRTILTALRGVLAIIAFAFIHSIVGILFADILVDFMITYSLGGVLLALYSAYAYHTYLDKKWTIESKRKR